MSEAEFFPARPDVEPMIYAYEEKNPRYAGMLGQVGVCLTGEHWPDTHYGISVTDFP